MVTGTTRSSGQASIMATSRAAGQLGQELGVAGMPEARILQRLLLDRIGGEAGDLAGLRQPGGALDRLERRRRHWPGSGWPAVAGALQPHRQHRQRRREHRGSFGGRGDLAHRHGEAELAGQRRQPRRIVDREERPRCRCAPATP